MRVGAASMMATLAVALTGASASAQSASPEVVAIAMTQFDRGVAAMAEGDFSTGCPALAESVRLDRKPGALFTLAECESKWGRLASADAHYVEYLEWFDRMTPDEQSRQHARDRISRDARAELAESIPLLTLRLTTALPPGAVVKRDGVALGAASVGVPLPIDPGEHEMAVELASGAATRRTVSIEVGARDEVVLDVPVDSAPVRVASAPQPLRRKLVPLASLGVGIAGVAVGAAFGLAAMSQASEVDAQCRGVVCTPEGVVAAESAQTSALVSTIGFGVGIAGIGAGALLLLMGSKRAPSSAASASFTVAPAGVAAVGAF